MKKKCLGGDKRKMRTTSIFIIAMMIAMIGLSSVAIADQETQEVDVIVDAAVPGLSITPSSYNYGSVTQGQCSNENPDKIETNSDGTIQLSSTGNVDIEVTTVAAGIFAGIDYCIGDIPCTSWIDVNDFSVVIPFGDTQSVNTQICVPGDYLGYYPGIVTFEYISVP